MPLFSPTALLYQFFRSPGTCVEVNKVKFLEFIRAEKKKNMSGLFVPGQVFFYEWRGFFLSVSNFPSVFFVNEKQLENPE